MKDDKGYFGKPSADFKRINDKYIGPFFDGVSENVPYLGGPLSVVGDYASRVVLSIYVIVKSIVLGVVNIGLGLDSSQKTVERAQYERLSSTEVRSNAGNSNEGEGFATGSIKSMGATQGNEGEKAVRATRSALLPRAIKPSSIVVLSGAVR